jgi:hypothetical protein
MTMANQSKDRRERAAAAQYEVDALALREKTARLRALRLAREAAVTATAAAPATGRSTKAVTKKAGKAGATRQSLSEWLAAQQKEGLRN